MPEVAASVGLVEAQGRAGGAPIGGGDTKPAETPGVMNFADPGDGGDRASTILDEVLAGGQAPAEGGEAPAVEGKAEPAKVEEKPAETPPPVPVDAEAEKLRRGFAKLGQERQKLIELQNAARSAKAAAESYATKAQKHDELTAAINADPAAFLLAHGGEALVQKALQGFIDMEKSPAEREVAKVRQELADRDKAQAQRDAEAAAAKWRNDGIAKIQADERFDLVNTLGLHGDVVNVITGYYDKYSERDAQGNVTKPAILTWEDAAQAVEEQRAQMLDKSKRYGKRTPAAAEATPPKDAQPAKPAAAPAKKAPTSLSSVPVADTPASPEDDFPTNDNDARERQLLAEFGF